MRPPGFGDDGDDTDASFTRAVAALIEARERAIAAEMAAAGRMFRAREPCAARPSPAAPPPSSPAAAWTRAAPRPRRASARSAACAPA